MSPHYYKSLLEDDEPRSLGDWVRNFRVKKNQMKRKVRAGASLRISAIITTALLSAEHELRRKQQERFSRWLDFQTNLRNGFTKCRNARIAAAAAAPPKPPKPGKMRICATEVKIINVAAYNDFKCVEGGGGYANIKEKDNQEINDIWRSELNSLDEFMRCINNKSQNGCKPVAAAAAISSTTTITNAIEEAEKQLLTLTEENGEGGGGGGVADDDHDHEHEQHCDRNDFNLIGESSPAIRESSSLIMTN